MSPLHLATETLLMTKVSDINAYSKYEGTRPEDKKKNMWLTLW
jgi:hypothetical protein